jgi:ABC-type molybdenum transport system ATPase subunit/photorepair protein PhrA
LNIKLLNIREVLVFENKETALKVDFTADYRKNLEVLLMHEVTITNCNNIENGTIRIEKNKLNIKYGINGTGKTTLSKAIFLAKDNDKLQSLRTYNSETPAEVSVIPELSNVLIFDENFVNQVVFKEDKVIENTFEVFLKTPNYNEKKQQLDNHLLSLKKIMEDDQEIIELRDSLLKINDKFKRTSTGTLSKTGTLKSLLSKQNIYNIPVELEDYKPFFNNTDINIPWIDWKNKGDAYDIVDHCPYCSEKLDISKHTEKKEIFKKTYTKSDSQNLKEVLELLENLKTFIREDKYVELIGYIKNDTPKDIVKTIMTKLTTEFDLLLSRFYAISEFGYRKIAIADISKLEQQINNMEFPIALFEIFGGEKIDNVFSIVNVNVASLKAELSVLKREMGALKGIVQATIQASQSDINEFLKTSGINYELEILAEDETNSKTILKQCFGGEKTGVPNIRQHLSWGEKNAFSLILFMYYSQTQNPDLIILDDPISSFDSNKKFAIMHRMFKNIGKRDVSLVGKTVLLLTHDFEPITDFIVVGKLSSENATASFVWNENGVIQEKVIYANTDVKLIIAECEEIAKNESINIVSRIAFLRKLCELNDCKNSWDNAYEILSCLIHGNEIKRKIANDVFIEMSEADKNDGISKITEYISNFDYDNLKDNTYTIAGIKDLYDIESNAYLQVQLFRAICEIADENKLRFSPLDSGWYKFIDETYHIENDFLHYLDIRKFNIVPSYISNKVKEMMNKLNE